MTLVRIEGKAAGQVAVGVGLGEEAVSPSLERGDRVGAGDALRAPRPGRSGPHRGQHPGLRSPAGRHEPASRRCRLARTDSRRRSVHLPRRRELELLSTRVGVRPMPADGEPIVGPVAEVPGLYLAVMHSAVTLAPAVGRLVARELIDGTVEPALVGCSLDRF